MCQKMHKSSGARSYLLTTRRARSALRILRRWVKKIRTELVADATWVAALRDETVNHQNELNEYKFNGYRSDNDDVNDVTFVDEENLKIIDENSENESKELSMKMSA